MLGSQRSPAPAQPSASAEIPSASAAIPSASAAQRQRRPSAGAGAVLVLGCAGSVLGADGAGLVRGAGSVLGLCCIAILTVLFSKRQNIAQSSSGNRLRARGPRKTTFFRISDLQNFRTKREVPEGFRFFPPFATLIFRP